MDEIIRGQLSQHSTIINIGRDNYGPIIINDITPLSAPSKLIHETRPGDLIHLKTIENIYTAKLERFKSLSSNKKNYDEKIQIYKEILHFTGYREKWPDLNYMSYEMLKLSTQVKDIKSSGLIAVKGIVYPYMEQGQYDIAENYLKQAYKYFQKNKDDIGMYYEYMGSVYEASNKHNKALEFYNKAKKSYKYDDIDRHKIHLQILLMQAKNNNDSSKIDDLYSLCNNFNELASYREGLARMEMAKTLLKVGESQEAKNEAAKSFTFFHEIKMPRNERKAEKLLTDMVNLMKINHEI